MAHDKIICAVDYALPQNGGFFLSSITNKTN